MATNIKILILNLNLKAITMIKYFMVLVVLLQSSFISAQEVEIKTGPIIKKYGKVYQVNSVDLQLNYETKYKVIFDIYTDNSKNNSVNPLLNAVARYLNMHAQQGILLENMKVAVILHGAATKYTINELAFQEQFGVSNPNSELLQELNNANVELYVCGQSYIANGFKIEDKSSNIKLALSALTALVKYQSEGYNIINFN
jgi:intracellular sulfur oxidation DsrE/DsrF family protein